MTRNFHRSWIFAVTGILVLSLNCISVAQTSAPTTTGRRGGRGAGGPPPSATQPVIQRGTDNRHAQFLEVARKGDIDLLFLGDSITDFWRLAERNGRPAGKAVWDQYFAPLKAANFGINADRTQHLLWRLQNGELEGFKAKCIVLLIGTNNIGTPEQPRNTVEDTIAGVKLVVNEIRQRQPQAKLLLLAIFPRGNNPDDGHRPGIKLVNDTISKLHDGKNIFFMDINDKFLQADGALSADNMPDYLHPSEKGYQIWADAIIGKVKELMEMK
jgi:lysophospholipase L1-like esterase